MKFDDVIREWTGIRPERSEWDALKQQERSHRDYLRGDKGYSDKRASRDPGLEHAMSMMPKKLEQDANGFYTDETGKRWEMKKRSDGPPYLVPLKEGKMDQMSPEERDAYEAELDKKESYKDYLTGHNSDEEAAYLAAREILDSLKARNPEKYGKIVSALNYLTSHNE